MVNSFSFCKAAFCYCWFAAWLTQTSTPFGCFYLSCFLWMYDRCVSCFVDTALTTTHTKTDSICLEFVTGLWKTLTKLPSTSLNAYIPTCRRPSYRYHYYFELMNKLLCFVHSFTWRWIWIEATRESGSSDCEEIAKRDGIWAFDFNGIWWRWWLLGGCLVSFFLFYGFFLLV